MKKTKEETFLLKLHDLALLNGDPFAAIDRDIIGKALGFGKSSTGNIIKVLSLSHLIKKSGDKKVHLTDNGYDLINQLKTTP